MKNLNIPKMTIEEMDKVQKELVNNIESRFKEIGKTVNLSYTEYGYNTERDIIINIYSNKYDYKRVSYVFDPTLNAETYVLGALSAIKEEGKFKEHIASPEEIYIIELLEATKCKGLYVLDGQLHSDNSDSTVDLSAIEEMHYNKVDSTITFIEDNGEKSSVNLATETIICVDINSSGLTQEEIANAEPITIEFINQVVKQWNGLNYWCFLELEDTTIYLLDKKTNSKTKLIDINNIESIIFKDKTLFVSFIKEDEHGFNCLELNESGIDY